MENTLSCINYNAPSHLCASNSNNNTRSNNTSNHHNSLIKARNNKIKNQIEKNISKRRKKKTNNNKKTRKRKQANKWKHIRKQKHQKKCSIWCPELAITERARNKGSRLARRANLVPRFACANRTQPNRIWYKITSIIYIKT